MAYESHQIRMFPAHELLQAHFQTVINLHGAQQNMRRSFWDLKGAAC